MSERTDLSRDLQARVRAAAEAGEPLQIVGGNSKAFLGRAAHGTPLHVAGHTGVLSYEPTELVVTARAGTPLRTLQAELAARGQMLAFEPPHFGVDATLGGTVAAGLSGPRRPYAGAVRDFVLGCTLLNGAGEILRFGGEVMKNVAGYDVSRLMAGAYGTLGILLDVSLKVLPQPARELTLWQQRPLEDALQAMVGWSARPLPLSAAAFDGERLYVRLSGAESAVKAAAQRIGGEPLAESETFWERVREHRHGFFHDTPLWRVSVPAAAAPLPLPGKWFIDWGGAQRWLHSSETADSIRQAAAAAGGHATLFRGATSEEVFQPLSPALAALHRRLKQAFDPAGILNPGRLYAEL